MDGCAYICNVRASLIGSFRSDIVVSSLVLSLAARRPTFFISSLNMACCQPSASCPGYNPLQAAQAIPWTLCPFLTIPTSSCMPTLHLSGRLIYIAINTVPQLRSCMSYPTLSFTKAKPAHLSYANMFAPLSTWYHSSLAFLELKYRMLSSVLIDAICYPLSHLLSISVGLLTRIIGAA